MKQFGWDSGRNEDTILTQMGRCIESSEVLVCDASELQAVAVQYDAVLRASVYLRLLVVLLLATSCSTPYQPEGLRGGHSEDYVGNRSYRVAFAGNGYTSARTVHNMLLLRCAEITLREGYGYFVVSGRNNFQDHSSTYVPPTPYTYGYSIAIDKHSAALFMTMMYEFPGPGYEAYDAWSIYKRFSYLRNYPETPITRRNQRCRDSAESASSPEGVSVAGNEAGSAVRSGSPPDTPSSNGRRSSRTTVCRESAERCAKNCQKVNSTASAKGSCVSSCRRAYDLCREVD